VARLELRVTPRASRDEIAGERGGAVLVRVTAPPVEGKANIAVRKLLARRLGVPAGRIAVVRGETARDKVIEVQGVAQAELRRALGLDA
jgi:uncharacterized protein (TIGR00251 family)